MTEIWNYENIVLGEYTFHWLESGIIQDKILISHNFYVSTSDKEFKELIGTREWFTNLSPLYDAISTGVMNCNGIYYCNVILKS